MNAVEGGLNVCIIHDSSIVKNIIREYIRTDHPDADVFLAVPAPDLCDYLRTTTYDIVFCGLEMERLNIGDIHSALAGSDHNAMTPLVAMTATDTEDVRDRLSRRGLRHILPLPCSSTAFRKLIYRIFNPDSNRVHRMYYVPNSTATVEWEEAGKTGKESVSGEIIHVGRDTVTCEIPLADSMRLRERTAFRNGQADHNADNGEGNGESGLILRLRFPADYGKASAIEIVADIPGIKEVIPVADPERIQIVWRIRWQAFELHAATKRSLRMHMGDPSRIKGGAASEDVAFLTRQNDKLADRNAALQSELDEMVMENERLIRKINQLNRQVERLESASTADEAARARTLGALINEKPNPSKDPARLAIFKRLIKDNIRIRENDAD